MSDNDVKVELEQVRLAKIMELLNIGDIIAVASELGIPIKCYYMSVLELPCGHILPIIAGLKYLIRNRECIYSTCLDKVEFNKCVIR